MSFSEKSCLVFEQATKAYHITDHIDATVHNPYEVKSIEFYLYLKNWIDAVQWHMEDIIRNPAIEPTEGLVIKRRIDKRIYAWHWISYWQISVLDVNI